MARRMSSSSWVARYCNGGDVINFNEITDARSQALNEGHSYLLKIFFIGESDFAIEEAFSGVEDALAVAERLHLHHPNVKAVVVSRMHGTNLFGDGRKHYQYLTGIKTFCKD